MIEELVVRNFQSLRHVSLQLGKFTVIVGASSSGKTALMRAIRGLASNVKGTSQLTRGATSAHITARTGDQVVSLEHAKGSWFYRVTTPDGERDYTKLAGSVPAAVTEILGLPPVGESSLNYCGQFDRPFLVGEPGSKVARTLGELTNVDVILAAVTEANRVRRSTAAGLRVRLSDLSDAQELLARMCELEQQVETFETAEHISLTAKDLHRRVVRLAALLDELDTAEETLATSPALVLPDAAALDAAHARYTAFIDLLREHARHTSRVAALDDWIRDGEDTVLRLERELQDTLVEAGICPTCGQPVGQP